MLKQPNKKINNIIFLFIIIFLSVKCGATLTLTEEELNNPDKLLDKGRAYYADDEYDIALEVFQMVVDRFPNRTYSASWAQYEIGMTHYVLGEFEKARNAFIMVIQKYPIPMQPRILSLKLIRKIDHNDTHKRSSYKD